MNGYNSTKKKILLLLLAGVALNFTYSPKRQRKILKELSREWKKINRDKLYYYVREFYNDRLVEYKEFEDGSIKVVLTENGKKKALLYNIEEMEIKKPDHWDGKWRLVIFDIPEKIRKGRDALRDKLKDLGFKELQKSVFIHPYPCKDEIDFITEVFELRKYVRFAEVTKITNEAQLKLRFGLE